MANFDPNDTWNAVLSGGRDVPGSGEGFGGEFGRYFASSLTLVRRSDLSSSPTQGFCLGVAEFRPERVNQARGREIHQNILIAK